MSGTILPVLVFSLIASPFMFSVTRCVAPWIASPEGLATVPGLFVHALVFVLLLALLRVLFFRRAPSSYLSEGGMKFGTRDDQDDQNTMHFQENRLVYPKN